LISIGWLCGSWSFAGLLKLALFFRLGAALLLLLALALGNDRFGLWVIVCPARFRG
jgi:hypothetical protein